MKYAIVIAAGFPTRYGRKQGWDDLHDTRAEAEAAAVRARKNDGLEARVIEVSAEEALTWNETVGERLARERRELDERIGLRR